MPPRWRMDAGARRYSRARDHTALEEEKAHSKERMEALGRANEEDLEWLRTMYEERTEELKGPRRTT